jgi:hypothetical protein
MIDPSILLYLQTTPLPPEPPLMVYERLWQSKAGLAAERSGRRLVESYRGYADGWLKRLEQVRDVAQTGSWSDITPEVGQFIDELIEETEALAESRAKGAAREEKKIRADVKKVFRLDPSVGAAARTVGHALMEIDRGIIEALLDQSLFLRAVRAESLPSARSGPIFDDPADLDAYLKRELA